MPMPGRLEGDLAGALDERCPPSGSSRCGWWPCGLSFVGAVDGVCAVEPCRVGDNGQVTTLGTMDSSDDVLRRDRRLSRPSAKIVARFYEGVAERRGAAAALPRGGPRPGRGAVPAVPGAVLGRPDDVLRAARPPAAADAARAVRGDAAGQGPLAAALPGRPRRGRPHPGAGRAVLGLRHARRAVHGEHLRGAA